MQVIRALFDHRVTEIAEEAEEFCTILSILDRLPKVRAQKCDNKVECAAGSGLL